MTYFGPQFLYTSDLFGNAVELINGARTARRLQRDGGLASVTFSDVLENAGCDALTHQPSLMAADGSVECWTPLDFTPEGAPWFTGSTASSEGFGFYIDEWTGLDGAHHGRSVTGVGSRAGGAYFGPLSNGHRVMKLNVQLIGMSERGLNHLFRWLEDSLMQCCVRNGSRQVWLREFCPDNYVEVPTEGLAAVTRVALLEGPTWEGALDSGLGAAVRLASFTLGAGDPCMYRAPINCYPKTKFVVG